MIGTKYLSEVINVDALEIKKLNIIKAPTAVVKPILLYMISPLGAMILFIRQYI